MPGVGSVPALEMDLPLEAQPFVQIIVVESTLECGSWDGGMDWILRTLWTGAS